MDEWSAPTVGEQDLVPRRPVGPIRVSRRRLTCRPEDDTTGAAAGYGWRVSVEGSRVGSPVATRRDVAADVVLALVLGVLGVLEVWLPLPSALGDGSRELTTALTLWSSGWLVLRRRTPLLAQAAAVVPWPLAHVLADPRVLFWGGFVVFAVATYSVARYAHRRDGVFGGLVMAAALLVFDLRVEELAAPEEIAFHWVVLSVAWGVGRTAHEREARAARSDGRARLAEAESARLAAEAVAEERARIARELHDVVAHSVSVMVVQAGAATQVVEDYPDRARAALEAIRTTGAEALAEMRRLVGVLRVPGDEGALDPQPGTAGIPELVARARETGLLVELSVDGCTATLPPGVDLAAYRIVQEALSNVRRHAGASRACVGIRHRGGRLEVEVADDGHGVENVRPGHGLVGMRERVGLYGGSLDVRSATGKGFSVTAVLPVPEGST